jgi:mono/diheme cytochrome c family protein
MKIIVTLIVFIIIIIVAFLLFIYSGIYNISATEPHTEFTKWILSTATEQSVKSRAKGINVPPLSDESLVQMGFHHYNEMCATCHGAPGVKPSEIGKGLSPEPPDLIKESKKSKWNEAELFWIIKYGIKYTGMPAFGPTHSDEELWGIVAFLKRLPELSPEEYQTMEKAAGEKHHEHGHMHEHKTKRENLGPSGRKYFPTR